METVELIVVFILIMAVLGIVIGCIAGFLDSRLYKEQSVCGIPDEVMDKILCLWQHSPGTLNKIDKVIDDYRFLTDWFDMEMKEKESRQKLYEALEKRWEETGYEPAPWDATLEEFQLWAVLTAKYPMERSLLMERELQRICGRIIQNLSPEEKEVLFLLNRKAADEAADFYAAFYPERPDSC